MDSHPLLERLLRLQHLKTNTNLSRKEYPGALFQAPKAKSQAPKVSPWKCSKEQAVPGDPWKQISAILNEDCSSGEALCVPKLEFLSLMQEFGEEQPF